MSDDREMRGESQPGNKGGTQLPGAAAKGDHDNPDRAGAGEGPDAGTGSDTKTQDLAKAGRKDFDPNDGQE